MLPAAVVQLGVHLAHAEVAGGVVVDPAPKEVGPEAILQLGQILLAFIESRKNWSLDNSKNVQFLLEV